MIKFETLKKNTYPYPYMSTDTCFEESDLQKLIEEFPDVSNGNLVMGGRKQIDSKNLSSWLETSPTWKSFYDSLNNNETFNKITSDYSDEIKKWNGIIDDNFNFERDAFLHIDWSSANDGYTREIHRDTHPRIWNFIIFFNDKDWDGGDFLVHKSDGMTQFKQQLFGETLPVHEVFEAKKNRAVFFLSTPNSYHSVPIQSNTKTPRKFIYGAYTANNLTDVFRKKSL